jgi:hypothetical protein
LGYLWLALLKALLSPSNLMAALLWFSVQHSHVICRFAFCSFTHATDRGTNELVLKVNVDVALDTLDS